MIDIAWWSTSCGRGPTVRQAVEAFLDAPKIASNPNTLRAYTNVLDRAAAELGPDRQLAGVADDEIESALVDLWARRPRRPGTATARPSAPG